ncbi:hypothetical protein CDL15_Pgr021332 [Punica granatum]|uniref:Prolamin-like domain-containing protein n=1 Tax=Punica granatum TaxID=22663 RepID=A0A218WRX2_PUNGR|nr:hypothetical protein CDL15_Pgr021332 [Punica granatum]PKI77438.1 hypothetical protein CRG98_002211 [Punica granatum]
MAIVKSSAASAMALFIVVAAVCFSPAVAVKSRDKELHECLRGINDDCGVIIATWLMFNEALPPSVGCCTWLIDMGKQCHDDLVDALIEVNKYKGSPEDVKDRANELWQFCIFETNHDQPHAPLMAPAPAPAHGAQ